MWTDAFSHFMMMAAVFGMLLRVVGFVRAWDESREKAIPYALAASAIAVPVALIGLASLHKDLLFFRYLLFAAPALCLFHRRRDSDASGMANSDDSVLVTASAWNTSRTLHYRDERLARGFAAFIKAAGQPGDALVT